MLSHVSIITIITWNSLAFVATLFRRSNFFPRDPLRFSATDASFCLIPLTLSVSSAVSNACWSFIFLNNSIQIWNELFLRHYVANPSIRSLIMQCFGQRPKVWSEILGIRHLPDTISCSTSLFMNLEYVLLFAIIRVFSKSEGVFSIMLRPINFRPGFSYWFVYLLNVLSV